MSSLIPPTRRPGVRTTLDNHEARTRALERGRPRMPSVMGELMLNGGFAGDELDLFTTTIGPPLAEPYDVGNWSLSGVWRIQTDGLVQLVGFNDTLTDLLMQLRFAFVQTIGTTDREIVTGDPITVSPGSSEALSWDTHDAGSVLLDRTDVFAPFITATAVYAVSANVTVTLP
jgi:hypothetical protein